MPKAWILLDGHHKVEAAARLGCSVNCLVFAPCAEPYEPIEAEEEWRSGVQDMCATLWKCSRMFGDKVLKISEVADRHQ